MQRQGNIIESLPETVDIDHGSVSNNSGINPQNSLNNVLNPVDSLLPSYAVSSGGSTCINLNTHDVQSLSGWNPGEPSLRVGSQDQVNNDRVKMEPELSSTYNVRAGSSLRVDERRLEPTNILFPGRLHTSHNRNQVRSGPLFLQGSSSSHNSQNVHLNMRHVGISGNGGQNTGVSIYPSASSSSNGETSSGNSSHVLEENMGISGSSLGNWGLSCKRKALEGTPGQYSGGSSSSYTQAESSVWHTGSGRYDSSSSLNLSMPLRNSPSPPDLGVGARGVASDAFPSSVGGNTESTVRNSGRRVNLGQQQESSHFSLPSTGFIRQQNISPFHQSARSVPFNGSLELRSTPPATTNMGSAESQPHAMHISALSRNVQPFHWSGTSTSRVGSSSNLIPGEREAAFQEDANVRSIPRNNAEHPMFAAAADMRNVVQDPASWSLAPANIGTSGGAPSAARIGSSSGIHPFPTPGWIPPLNALAPNQQRLPDFVPWHLSPTIDLDSISSFPPLPSGPSVSSVDTMMASGSNSQGHRQQNRRSALLLERQSDDAIGASHSFRAVAADTEGRHRLISEIRQVLNAMRRGENLRIEDYMLFDPFVYYGMAEMQDRHRDMRLDVDNMSYEELLALEERIGDVSTGLPEETILRIMKQHNYVRTANESALDVEPCCICQEEYADGDELGRLDCGHDFHTNCIKQWLVLKNLCPICKTTALFT